MRYMRMVVAVCTIILCVLLSGCFRGDFKVTINKDGSADVDYSMMAAPILSDKINELKTDAIKNGMTVVDAKEGDWKGLRAKKHLATAEELQYLNIFQNKSNDGQGVSGLIVERGWFFDKYILNTNMDFSSGKKKQSKEDKAMEQAMLSQVQMKFILNLPVAAETNNAGQVQNEGKTLEWNLAFGEGNQVQAQVKIWNWGHVGLTIAVFVVMVFLGIYIYKMKRQENANSNKIIISICGLIIISSVVYTGYYYSTLPKLQMASKPVETVKIDTPKDEKNNPNNQKQATANDENAGVIQKVQSLLKGKNIQGTVLATSFGNNQNGSLSLVKGNNQYKFVIFDNKNQQVAEVPFVWSSYNFILDKNKKSPLIFKMTIINDTQNQDAKNGVWNGANHLIPIYALYDFDQGGKVIPGMLTTGIGEKPSHYQGFLKEQKNVDITNLFLTEMAALHENIKINKVDMSFD